MVSESKWQGGAHFWEEPLKEEDILLLPQLYVETPLVRMVGQRESKTPVLSAQPWTDNIYMKKKFLLV